MEHTKTPWYLETNPCTYDRKAGIFSDDGKYIGSATMAGLSKEEAISNAAYIVRAVNAHEKMVWALKEIRGCIEGKQPSIITEADLEYIDSVAALALAEK